MHSKTKIIIGLVVLALVIVLAYFLNPKNSGENQVVDSKVEYKNTEYGFAVTLPTSWTGYAVVTDTWKGDSLDTNGNMVQGTVSGPFISVRHPLWTQEAPRQDIPVYVFTIQQWNDMQADKFHIGATPINPSELARNANYVFALPARYNFAYLPGFEEVDLIVRGDNFSTFDPYFRPR